ncbi:hypothetical protein ACFLV3_00220 [Chloroflexota bacterium]
MKGHGTKLPFKQEDIISALLIQPTMEKAANAAHVSISTVRRYMQLPEFRARYLEARRQVLESAMSSLQQVTNLAVNTLVRNLACGNPSVEVRAAMGIFDQSLKAMELFDLENRLNILEKTLKGRGDGHVNWLETGHTDKKY